MRVPTIFCIASAGAFSLLVLTGCGKQDEDRGDLGVAGSTIQETSQTAADKGADAGMGGTGSAPTSIGSGATNGAIGNETLNAIAGPGNIPSGAGSTTQPAATQP
jgi:hypothetical protein